MSEKLICIGGVKGKDQEMDEMRNRIKELESVLHLALAVAPDDPILTTEAEKQVVELQDRVKELEAEAEHKVERFAELVEVRLTELLLNIEVVCKCGRKMDFDRETEGDKMKIIVEPCPVCIPVKETP